MDKVHPAIQEKFPRRTHQVLVQQDNAAVHLEEDDAQLAEFVKQVRRNFKLVAQPPNSPDFNVLDLSFFRAIQSRQYESSQHNMEELIEYTLAAFNAHDPTKL